LAVDPEQNDFDEARTFAVLFEREFQPRPEALDGAEHVALEHDRLGEALLGDIKRQGVARGDGFLGPRPGLVEAAPELAARTGPPARRAGDPGCRRYI